jgi:hypothetical protein
VTNNDQYPGSEKPQEPVNLTPTDPDAAAQVPGIGDEAFPLFPPAATQATEPAFPDDPTIVRDRGVAPATPGSTQQSSAPATPGSTQQSSAPATPGSTQQPSAHTPPAAPFNYLPPGQPGFPAGSPAVPPAGPPTVPPAGWGAPASQPYPTPDQPYPIAPYAGATGANVPPTMAYGAPGAYPPPGQAPAGGYPFPPGGQPPASSKKGGKIALFVGLGVAVLVLGLVAFIVIRSFGGASTSGHPATAKAAVQAYLQALAAGDASAAIDLGEAAPSDLTLLTDDVLKSSIARAPITNIQVQDAAGSTVAFVTATYQLGDTAATGTFEATKIGSEWRLKDTAQEVDIFGADSADLTLNGIVFDRTDTLTLFPGSYVLASQTDRLTVEGGEFVLKSPMDYSSPSLSFSLSDKGLADARAAAQTLLNSCVKQNDLAPIGCGFGFKAGNVKVKTVKWRISSGATAIEDADFTISSSDPSVATAYVYIVIGLTVKDTAGRTYVDQDSIGTIKADLSGPDVSITFS